MRRFVWCLVLFATPSAARRPAPEAPPSRGARTGQLTSAVRFEENRGQFPDDVAFLVRQAGFTLRLPRTGGTASFHVADRKGAASLGLEFVGANAVRPEAEQPLNSHSNYFIGRDRAAWRTGVRHFGRVRYRALYPGVDLVYHGEREGAPLEFDLVVQPGGDPSVVRVRTSDPARLDSTTGQVHIARHGVGLVVQAPDVYQDVDGERRPVPGRFRLLDEHTLQFEVGAWDRTRALTIDPVVISYSSYVGGSGGETVTDLAVDAQGMIYVTGQTRSTNFPTDGPVQAALASAGDAYVLKVDPNGTGAASLIYATYLGSTGNDEAEAIRVDATGRAYVAGFTHAGDFPVTANAFKGTFVPSGAPNDDESDAFATILDASGGSLVYSTFFGGNRDDEAMGIAPRGPDEMYIGGTTDGGTFPTTTNAFDQSGQTRSAFVSVLNWSTNTLRYSTVYHANPNQDVQVRGMAVDGTGRAHVTGIVRGAGLATPGGFQAAFPQGATTGNGQFAAFLAVFDPSQTGTASLVYGTHLGVGEAQDVATDTQGQSVVVGSTNDAAFPTTPAAFQTVCQNFIVNGQNLGCSKDGFAMRIDPGQSGAASLRHSTRLGGARSDEALAVVVDAHDSVVVTGSTTSAGFPVDAVVGETTPRPDGEGDAYVLKLAPQLNTRGLAARVGGVTRPSGGTAFDRGLAVGVAPDGAVCVAGETEASDFPVVRGFDATLAGFVDAFVLRLGNAPSPCVEVSVGVQDGRDFDWEPPLEICMDFPGGGFGGLPRPCPPPECPRCERGPGGPVGGGGIPAHLVAMYRAASPVLGAGGPIPRNTKRPLPAAMRMHRAVGTVPQGTWVTPTLIERTQSTLSARSPAVGLAQQRRAATELLNAMELDWRLGGSPEGSKQAKSGLRSPGMARVDGRDAGNVEVHSGLPAWPDNPLVRTAWPLASFQVDGKRGGMADLELDISWMHFAEGAGEYRILAWNGRRYRAVKPTFDPVRQVLKGLVPIGERLVVIRLVPCRIRPRPFNP